jgi:hybrid cluster-associated redox disulfide protein
MTGGTGLRWPNLRQRKDTGGRRRDPQSVASAPVLNMLVSDVLAASPAAAGLFLDYGMGCVGCAFARFETVAEAAAAYGLDGQELARSLTRVLRAVKRGREYDHHRKHANR